MSAVEERALRLDTRAESLPVRACKFCGAEIAWVKSKRTGKNYPANVYRTPSESATKLYNLRVAPWDAHTRKQCEERQAERTETKRLMGITRVCAAADCGEEAAFEVDILSVQDGTVTSTPEYCKDHAEGIRESNAKIAKQGIPAVFSDPRPLKEEQR